MRDYAVKGAMLARRIVKAKTAGANVPQLVICAQSHIPTGRGPDPAQANLRGKICPGRRKSTGTLAGSASVRMVLHLSVADTPVLTLC